MNLRYFSLILVFLFFAPHCAFSDDYSTKVNLQISSVKGVFFQTSMPILETEVNLDRMATLKRNLKVLKNNTQLRNAEYVQDRRMDSAGLERWNYTSYGVGDSASYHDNDELFASIQYISKRENEPVSKAEAFDIAKEYINHNLKDIIKTSQEDGYQPFHLRYTKYRENEIDRVSGYLIIFSRLFKSFNVIGPGSKIRVHIGANERVIGYRYDWPGIHVKSEVTTVSRDDFFRRLSRICDYYGLDCKDVVFSRFECGIFDYGALARFDSEIGLLQPACYVQINDGAKEDEGSRVSFYIPLAEDWAVVPDSAWKESLIIKNMLHLMDSSDGGIKHDPKLL